MVWKRQDVYKPHYIEMVDICFVNFCLFSSCCILFWQGLLPFGKCIYHTPWQVPQREQNVFASRDEHVLSTVCF